MKKEKRRAELERDSGADDRKISTRFEPVGQLRITGEFIAETAEGRSRGGAFELFGKAREKRLTSIRSTPTHPDRPNTFTPPGRPFRALVGALALLTAFSCSGPSGNDGGSGGSGGSGGGTGGGSGGGAGGGCATFASFPFQGGGYQGPQTDSWYGMAGQTDPNVPIDGGFTFVSVRVGLDGGAVSLPLNFTVDQPANAQCKYCFGLAERCQGGTASSCVRTYAARAGTGTITAASRNLYVGQFTLSATNLNLIQWDSNADVAVDGGLCANIPSLSINFTWDAGVGPPCVTDFAGCTTYDDYTDGGVVAVSFGLPNPTPQCIQIKVGQSVAFSGASSTHPLSHACGPVNAIGTSLTAGTTVLFDSTGDYGYFCDNHGDADGGGMSASIRVVP